MALGRAMLPEQHPRGSALGHRVKLTEAKVSEIRSRYTGKYGQLRAFAKEYGVHPDTIRTVVRRTQWKHVN